MENKYMRELQALRPHDEVQSINSYGALRGYNKIYTAGHGYLIVPITDKNIQKAKELCEYGYMGIYAIYLEEDCELGQFLDAIA